MHIHDSGIRHRHLKPENILLAKITDFALFV
jgi:serine/threonine protein kinase